MPDLIALEAEAWGPVLADVSLPTTAAIVVRGSGAAQLAAVLRRLGYGGDGLAVSEEPVRLGERVAVASADAAILLHAWGEPRLLDPIAQTAVRWLRPGAVLVLADLDIATLRTDSPRRTPAAMFYQLHPDVADRIAARSPTRIQLAMAGIRTGLDDVRVVDLARPVGIYDDPSERRAAVEFGAWRGLEDLASDAYTRLLDAVDMVPHSEWPLVEREPWIAVTGRVRP